MKIYIGKDKIKQTNNVQYKDIPLSFIDTFNSKYKINFNIRKDFSSNIETKLKAYDIINNPSSFFFDSKNKIIKDIEIKRIGNMYLYEPRNTTEFSPVNFSVEAIIKKQMKFSDTENYNLKVCVVDTNQDLPLANKLIKIFGDGYSRNLCPSNIKINEGTLIPQYLLKYQPNECDFMFAKCESIDKLPNKLDFQKILNGYCNLWCFVSKHTQTFYETNEKTIFYKEEGHLNNFYRNTERKKRPEHFFRDILAAPGIDSLVTLGFELEQVYEDVLIYSKKNSGYLIVTPESFLDNIIENSKIVYDVMMYIFLKSYYKSQNIQSWITNDPIDYIAQSDQKINIYHKKINLEELLKNKNYNIGNQYKLINIKTSNPNILFVGMSNSGDLYFRKQNNYMVDPKKTDQNISYFTTRHTVLFYKQEDIHYKETKINLSYFNKEDKLYVEIDPIYSSSQQIYIPYKQTLEILDVNKKYYICTKHGHVDKINTLSLIDVNNYSMDLHGIILAEINIETEKSFKAIDIRIFGGGLPENTRDNFNMIDIGNIYGRPYRLGSTLIIKLPKTLEKYEKLLLKEIEKHISSGETPILIFE